MGALANHTTLRLGGPAGALLTHTDPTAWPDLAHAIHRESVRPHLLGGGSNILAADAGLAGLVILMATRGITAHLTAGGDVEVTAQAGEPLSALVDYTVAEGLSGIEYLGGIPGTTGAAPIQNSGAYGQQISDVLTQITAYDWQSHTTTRLLPAACAFGYRTSVFKTQPWRWTILTVTLRLRLSAIAAPVAYRHLAEELGVPLGTRPSLAEAAEGVLANRRARGLLLPKTGPDSRQAGSVFLNPPVSAHQAAAIHAAGGPVMRDLHGVQRASAGWLLEQAGYRPGCRLAAGVYCSTHRTLTLTARERATASGFAAALRTLATEVHTATGIRLRPEPVMLGFDSQPVHSSADWA
ncbi:UDP-N-acetylmuramate dehydrogenase [Sphaerisporangium sp. NPDC051017]|uniref:UDP-N-acetylmuramate dehydrogenase n=1 Tax=Sphaerisporangium sp. NPDC051017 TaxID=3154636 RepID=UPI0034455F68